MLEHEVELLALFPSLLQHMPHYTFVHPWHWIDKLQCGITATDNAGNIVIFNHRAQELFDLAYDDMLGQNINEIATPLTYSSSSVLHDLNSGKNWFGMVHIRQENNHSEAIDVIHAPLFNNEGQCIGIVSCWDAKAFEHSLLSQASANIQTYTPLFQHLEQSSDSVLAIDSRGTIIFANKSLEFLLGYDLQHLVQSNINTITPPRLQANQLTHILHYLVVPVFQSLGIEPKLYVKHRQGYEIPLNIAVYPYISDSDWFIIVTMRPERTYYADALYGNILARDHSIQNTKQHNRDTNHVSSELSALRLIIEDLATVMTPMMVAEMIVQQELPRLGAEAGAFLSYDQTNHTFQLLSSHNSVPHLFDGFATILAQESQYLKQIAHSGQAVWQHVYDDPSQCGWKRANIPLLFKKHVIGMLCIRFPHDYEFDQEHQTLLSAVAHECAQALERARIYEAERLARAELEIASARLTFLSQASVVLAEYLDEQSMLERIATLAVPTLADFCMFDMLTPSGQLRRSFWHHHDPAIQEQLHHTREFQPEHFTVHHMIWRVLQERKPQLFNDFDDSWAQDISLKPDQVALIQLLGVHSLLITPLCIYNKNFGVMTFGYHKSSQRRYDQSDLTLMQDFARRIALAIEHIRLHMDARTAHAQAERAQQQARFLADASILLSQSFDQKALLQRFTQMSIPRLADFCVIFLQNSDGVIHRVASAHVDPAQEIILHALHSRPLIMTQSKHPVVQVIRSGQMVLNPYISDETMAGTAHNQEEIAWLRKLHPHSHIIMPLIARNQVIGAISFGMSESQRYYRLTDLALIEDLTQRAALAIDNARLYQLAQNALKVRDSFLMVAAHELKNPLSALIGNIQLLQRRMEVDMPIDARHIRSLEILNEQTQRIHKLIMALLDLTQMQSGKIQIVQETVDLCTLVKWIVDTLQRIDTSHPINYHLPEHPVLVLGDTMRLEQVIQNLLTNAIKYSPYGSDISISVSYNAEQTHGIISVSDQGIGIPENEVAYLFELFYRASNTSKQHSGGMGIGLAVIKEIVTLHQGTIQVTSQEGLGSTFTVYLPLHPDNSK